MSVSRARSAQGVTASARTAAPRPVRSYCPREASSSHRCLGSREHMQGEPCYARAVEHLVVRCGSSERVHLFHAGAHAEVSEKDRRCAGSAFYGQVPSVCVSLVPLCPAKTTNVTTMNNDRSRDCSDTAID